MPIHLFWGDNLASKNRSIENLIKDIIDPNWSNINLSKFDGKEMQEINQIFSEVRTPPFGSGGRVVFVNNSSFCNGCSNEIGKKFEEVLDLIPENTHLILSNRNKPDGRLKTTKALQKLKSKKIVYEKSFSLPAFWDERGKINLIYNIAKTLDVELEEKAAIAIVEAIGIDTERIESEIEKLRLFEEAKEKKDSQKKTKVIKLETIKTLIRSTSTNSLEVGTHLIENNIGEALSKISALIDSGEPPLKIVASLTTQIRAFLWVSLLTKQNQNDIGFIAKAAGIANPKRIYFMQKQIKDIPSKNFLNLLSQLLEIEVSLKRGTNPMHAFQDGLLTHF